MKTYIIEAIANVAIAVQAETPEAAVQALVDAGPDNIVDVDNRPSIVLQQLIDITHVPEGDEEESADSDAREMILSGTPAAAPPRILLP